MSFTFGGNASKSTGTSNTATNSTTTPNVPDWLQAQTQGQSANIAKLGQLDPNSLVAGANPLQTQAGAQAASLTGSPSTLSAVNGLDLGVAGNAAPTVRSQSAAAGLDRWQNPFQQQVIDTTSADFDHQAAMQHAQRTLDEAHSGAFGGSGAALATTMGDDNSDRARATLIAGLRSTGFDTAAANSQQDATRAQEASTANANLAMQQEGLQLQAGQNIAGNSTAYDANQRANLSSMFDTGTGLRAIDQQQLTAPLDLQAWVNSQFGTLPSNLFVGQTTNGTSDTKTTGSQVGVNAGVTMPIPH
jgi:hypothetical protein